ncbi:hypothetical protein MKX01_014153 [Papaver californicum]|nr:hypothetical protein MKX01_014153 [Papaver californicum]
MTRSRVTIGYLLPVKTNLDEEDESIPKLEIIEVSRKHISLNASLDGSLEVTVEGGNPIAIKFGDGRKKFVSKESAILLHGDIVELIPRHYFFKYVKSAVDEITLSSGTDKRFDMKPTEDGNINLKRKRQMDEDEALARTLQDEMIRDVSALKRDMVTGSSSYPMNQGQTSFDSHDSCGTIPQFDVAKDKLPLGFRLLRVKELPSWANSSSVSIQDVIQGNVLVAVLSNYMVDMDWLISALQWPEIEVNLPVINNVKINSSFFRKFDYSNAAVRLIGSVPGYHTGSNLKKWGHMKLCSVLQDCVFDKDFQKSPLVYQFSSLGSLDEKWMAELASSMSSGSTQDKLSLGLGKELIVWPTVEDVRTDKEIAGSCIPSPQKNVEKDFLKKYWAKWKANHSGRSCAMPHIKTYTRYRGQNLAWFLLTSANLSKAAWGAL